MGITLTGRNKHLDFSQVNVYRNFPIDPLNGGYLA